MLSNCGAGEDSWESLGLQEIKPVNSKGNQFWVFIGRTDAEAETPLLWPPDTKSRVIGKDPDAGKDWRQKETGVTEIEVVGWHQLFDGHERGQALGDSEGQGGLVCRCSWGCKESETIWRLNNNNNNSFNFILLFSNLMFLLFHYLSI